MVRIRVLAIFTILLFLAASAAPASAASLRFQVDRAEVQVTINQDGSATIEYVYSFINDSSGSVIDAVDVGLPTNDYSLSNARADVGGIAISDISASPYVKPGIAFGLGAQSIRPGQRGVLHVVISNVGKLLYKTNKVKDVQEPYASFQFSPNSFGSQYVYGSTDLTVTLHLPTGLKAEEPRWFDPQNWPGESQPASGFDADGRVTYRWQSAKANSSTQYIFGAAFPARLVPAAALSTEPLIPSGTNFSWSDFFSSVFCVGFIGIFCVIIYISIKADRQRKLHYLPPKISVEGNGIKRGLTAVEAAILMEQPMDKVTTMILFSVVKKGAVVVTSRDPLQVQATPTPLPSGALYPYEADFVAAMTGPLITQRNLLQIMMVNLVKSISEKMRGFSRKETVAYYQDIMNRAWAQVVAANTPEMRTQALDDNLDWTLLDKDFNNRSQTVFGSGPVYLPIWWGNFDPGFGRTAATSAFSGPVQVGSAPGSLSLPSLPGSNFAASVAGGIQSMSSNAIGDLTTFTSGITDTTNPVPKTTYSSSGSGGGGHCACACACAGCACACAGGGR